ncbi:MAG: hypothetical protein ABI540_00760 [Spartobacteria bacterium]
MIFYHLVATIDRLAEIACQLLTNPRTIETVISDSNAEQRCEPVKRELVRVRDVLMALIRQHALHKRDDTACHRMRSLPREA